MHKKAASPVQPLDADTLHLRGIIQAQRGDLSGALELMDRAIQLNPDNAAFHSNRALALQRLKRLSEALASCDRALAIRPNYPGAFNNRGAILHDLGRFDEAISAYQRALTIDPNYAEALHNCGLSLQQLGRFDDALASYDRALEIRPDYADALISRGVTLHDLGQHDEALASYDRALAIRATDPLALNNRGMTLERLHRLDDALACYDRALGIRPDYGDALNNRAIILYRLNRCGEALSAYDRLVAVRPDSAEAFTSRGVVLHRLNRFDQALTSHNHALKIDPECGNALCNRGHVLRIQGNIGAAIACYRRAVEISGDAAIHTALIFALNFDASVSAAEQQIERAKWARRYTADINQYAAHTNDPDPHRRLRVGYVSAYFHRHASTYAFGGALVSHDPEQVHVTCYSDAILEDDVTACFGRRADQWRRTDGCSDEQLAEMIRQDRIDILVDLVGQMANHRLRVFARKPAPVQVTAWGEPTGTGLSAVDYLLADSVLVPGEKRGMLSERVAELPNFLGYWTPDELPEPRPPPALSRGYVTFGSLNRLDKLTVPTLSTWATILRRNPTARLILKDKALDDGGQRKRLETAFLNEGVSVDRLKLVGESDRREHFAVYNAIDIALDPFPHGGGITTLDAMWMGVPVVTWAGNSISSRLAAASLSALGLNDWIAPSRENYVDLALQKASDLERLSKLRANLRTQIASSEFGNPERYSRAVEAAYRKMWQRWCAEKQHPFQRQ